MDTIELGECPFCDGRVAAGLETARDGGGRTMVMAGPPECGRGCPVGRVMSPTALTVPASDGAGRLVDKWAQACNALLHPESCPVCDGHPAFAAIKADLWFGCPSDGLVKAAAGMPLVELVEKWNERARTMADGMRRQSELETECAVMNRAYWPDGRKGE